MSRCRSWPWLAPVLIAALVAWMLTAEIVEPHVLLWLQPASPALETASIAGTTLRLYKSTHPHIGKIAGLQKGLVWVQDGRALVEEGFGFGCPIIELNGQAYLSKHAQTEKIRFGETTRLIKRYHIDTQDTPIRLLRRKYRVVRPLGTVTVGYSVHSSGIVDIEVDFSDMVAPWDKAYLMNEQGAHRFRHYYDQAGVDLEGDDIGIWQRAGITVGRACFDSATRGLAFCVERGEASALYYGRERYWQHNWRGLYFLSWSGIDIEIAGPRDRYSYRVVLEAR